MAANVDRREGGTAGEGKADLRVTDDGMVTEVREVQYLKADSPISVRRDGDRGRERRTLADLRHRRDGTDVEEQS